MNLLNSVNDNNADRKLTVIANGDSWTFGSELVDPILHESNKHCTHVCQYDFLENNDHYRVPRTYASLLGDSLGANVVNLAWPADDNKSILQRTINYITKNYLEPGKSTDDIIVIIGWTSPERNSFWFKEDSRSHRFRIWPNAPITNHKAQEKILELYISYLWNAEEYIPRFIFNCLEFENFCYANGIKFLHFSAFYQSPKTNIDRWEDLNFAKEAQMLRHDGHVFTDNLLPGRQHEAADYLALWKQVDNVRFYKKDLDISTFKSFIDHSGYDKVYNDQGPAAGWHPNELGHELWAKELHRYIINNNLL